MTLEQASIAKLELVCDKLALGPDDHVLEIGTGWGGFAVHAAATRGCRVTTTTLSTEQRAHAQARVRAAGVEDRVAVLARDYRELEGRYDKLVSIEMIEAVGWKDFGTFFERCSDLLEPNGAMLLQAITIDDRAYAVERASRSFIRTHIFPNGCLPSVEVIARCLARRTDMRLTHFEDFGLDYAETLRRWRANLDPERLAELGYDERFQRLWRLYLSLLRGRVRRAADRGRPGAAGQAALGCSAAGRAAPGERAAVQLRRLLDVGGRGDAGELIGSRRRGSERRRAARLGGMRGHHRAAAVVAVMQPEHVAELVRGHPHAQRPRLAGQLPGQQHAHRPARGPADRRRVAEAVRAALPAQPDVVDREDDVGPPGREDLDQPHARAGVVPALRGRGDGRAEAGGVVEAHDPVVPRLWA